MLFNIDHTGNNQYLKTLFSKGTIDKGTIIIMAMFWCMILEVYHFELF